MQGLADALTQILSTDNFLGALTVLVPAIGALLVFGFVYHVVRRMLTKARTGKVGV